MGPSSGASRSDARRPGPVLTPNEVEHLERAARIAADGWGRVAPNPVVGCVLVRDGAVVAEGAHLEYGGPHAEIDALRKVEDASGVTAYVSLEPCDHHGKTPPCSEALIEAGVRRVVFGAPDPGVASGGGAERLRAAGIEVVGPVWGRDRARAENPVFHHHVGGASRPFLTVKLAMSLDGAVSAGPGVQTRITGRAAEHDVHRLRSGYDAVLVGRGTLLADDPRLTVRHATAGNRPLHRLLLVSDGVLPADARILDDLADAPVHLFYGPSADEGAVRATEALGVVTHGVDTVGGGLSIEAVLDRCQQLGIRSILSEAGPRLTASLLAGGWVDRVVLYASPHALPGGLQGLDGEGRRALEAFSQVLPAATLEEDERIILDRREDP